MVESGSSLRLYREGRRRLRFFLTSVSVIAVVLSAACSVGPSPGRAVTAVPQMPVPTSYRPPDGPILVVSPAGDDGNPGSRAAPLRTIEQAASIAVPGTTVIVAPGTYAGTFRTTTSGRPDARITYISEVKWGAKLVGDGSDEQVWRNDGDYVDIRGFDVSGTSVDGLLDTGSYVRMLDNHVYGFKGGSCLSTYRVEYTLHDIDIIGNVVHGCGSSSLHHGIYPGHPGGKVINNISYGNVGFGIHCWHNCNNLTISNNLVFDNGEGGILIGQGDGPNYGAVKADNMVVTNNIAIHNRAYGIRESGATGPSNRYVSNNVTGNADGGVLLRAGSEDRSRAGDPGFIDFRLDGSGDYHLRADSPDVDAGTPVGAPNYDIEGNPRPQGAGVDIGPYERAPG